MGKYSYAKEQLPEDWHRKIASDIKIEIKRYCLESVLQSRKDNVLREHVTKIINEFVDEFEEESSQIASGYREELTAFFEEALQKIRSAIGSLPARLFVASIASPATLTESQKEEIAIYSEIGFTMTSLEARDASSKIVQSDITYTRATAAGEYYRNVHKRTKAFINDEWQNYSESKNYLVNVNPRSIAEMNVRFRKYQSEKEALISRGVKLVYVPPHGNCSKRCMPYQSRVYSLDGTSGVIDGRRYIPIEDASENVIVRGVRDPSRTYYAGLFSYNCRHEMKEYVRGQNIEKIPNKEIEKQRRIEEQQRSLERRIRYFKEKEQTYRTLNAASPNADILKTARDARKKAQNLTRDYEAYSRKNGVPFYRERIRIVHGEDIYKRSQGKKSRGYE